jgi:hypothetical protein
MAISIQRIEALASRSKVNKRAVENFLCSLDGLSYQEAVSNCEIDAKSYKWNYETSSAIRLGIIEFFYQS